MTIKTRPDIKEGEKLQRAFICDVVKVVSKTEQTLDFVISTERVDRMGDIIRVNGWDLKEFRKNPVVLFAHNSRIPPIGRASNVRKEDGALRATAQFMSEELSPFAASIFRMYEERFLRATSVGFIPTKHQPIMDEKDQWTGGFEFLKQELLEFSAVPIPANPDALLEARSKGINVDPIKEWADQCLDDWKNAGKDITSLYGLDRKGFESFRKKAAGSGVKLIVPVDIQDDLLKRNLEAARKRKEENVTVPEEVKIKLGTSEWVVPLFKSETEPFTAKQLTVEEAQDGTKQTISLLDVPEKAVVAGAFLNDNNGFVSVDTEKGMLTFNGTFQVATYKAVGATTGDDGNSVIYMELQEVKDVESAEVKETGKEDEDREEAGKGSGDESEKEVVVEPKAEEAAATVVQLEKVVQEGTIRSLTDTLELSLGDLEDLLDNEKKLGHTITRRDERRLEFTAGLLREVADRLHPAKTVKEVAAVEEKAGKEDEIDVESFLKTLGPKLGEIVNREVNKARGRLD